MEIWAGINVPAGIDLWIGIHQEQACSHQAWAAMIASAHLTASTCLPTARVFACVYKQHMIRY